ncbi:MAG: BamA/TamA family outer membrane protein, partial [Verrucomicrobiota bacterium]
ADFLVRTLLEKEGYPEVDLRWRIPADRKSIELTVNSGPRFTLGKIDVRGVTPAQAETMAQYFTGIDPLTGKAPEAPYLQSKVRSAAGAANTYLKSLGYWKATSKLVEPFQFDRPNRQVNLTLLSEPGPLHTIGSISLEGNLPKNAQNMVTALQSLIGNTADATSLRRVQEGASATLRELGFQFATTNLSVTHSNGQSDLILTLDPGKRYLVGKTTLTGGESCNLDRVRRYFQSHSRKPFEEEKLRKFKNTLLSTSAFDSLTTERTINKEEGTIDLTLHLKEGKPRGFTYYLGAGSFEGAILGASYYDRNFLSQLYNLNIAAEYSAIGFLGEVSVTDPFWLGRDLRLTPRAFLLSREYDEYSKLESGVGLTLSTQPDKRNTFELDALLALNTSTPESLPSSAVGVRDYAVASIGLTWLHDRRDSGVSPSQGFYSRAHGEVGAVLGETSNGFFRLEGQAAYHWPLNDKSRLAFNLSTGFLASLDQNGFPIDLRYFWGGANSVRSFPARQLGPNINGFPTGGEAFWYSNVEYIRKIAGPLSAVAFLDAGSLDQSAASWPSLDPRLALGLGIRLDLPIGPVRIEYGRSLNPAPEDPPGAFHFAIGAAF